MKESPRNRNNYAYKALRSFKKTAPFIIFIFLALKPKLPSSPMMRDAFWASKFTQKSVYDYVIVGDSRAYRGIDPLSFARTLRAQAYNFGFSSACPDSVLIEHALEFLNKTGKKTVIITVSANSFMSGSIDNRHYHSLEALSKTDKLLRSHWYPWLTIFDNYSISDLYKMYKHEAYYERYAYGTGFAASDKIPSDSTSALSAYRKQFRLEKYSLKAENDFKQYVLRLRSRGYHPVVLRMPCTHAMLQLEDSATENAIPRLLRELGDEGIPVVPFYSGKLDSYDGSHLNYLSASKFTDYLIGYIKQLNR